MTVITSKLKEVYIELLKIYNFFLFQKYILSHLYIQAHLENLHLIILREKQVCWQVSKSSSQRLKLSQAV